ncbi:MAG: 50S ribosomal protein L21 [Planctomycetota bacterium]|jgi:large subunit ribosomal protein L21
MKENYAIIETGGKQYKVASGKRIEVDYLGVDEGKEVEFSRVLFIADDKDTIIGTPTIDDAKVVATCLGDGKGKKIIVFKYKPKTRYRVKKGHRQLFTKLHINEIVKPGGKSAKKGAKQEVTAGGED